MPLPRVFGQPLPAAGVPSGAQIEGTHVRGLYEVEATEGKGLREAHGVDATQGVGLFMTHNPRRAEGESTVAGGEIPFAIGTIYIRGVGSPIIALAAGEGFEAHALEGAGGEAQAAEVVVDAERGFFVSAQHEAGTELFIITAKGDFGAIEAGGGVKIGHAGTAEGGIEAGEGQFHVLGAQSCLITAAKREPEVEIGVAEHPIVDAISADAFVILGNKRVGAQTSVHLQGGFGRKRWGFARRRGRVVSFLRGEGQGQQESEERKEVFHGKAAENQGLAMSSRTFSMSFSSPPSVYPERE